MSWTKGCCCYIMTKDHHRSVVGVYMGWPDKVWKGHKVERTYGPHTIYVEIASLLGKNVTLGNVNDLRVWLLCDIMVDERTFVMDTFYFNRKVSFVFGMLFLYYYQIYKIKYNTFVVYKEVVRTSRRIVTQYGKIKSVTWHIFCHRVSFFSSNFADSCLIYFFKFKCQVFFQIEFFFLNRQSSVILLMKNKCSN